MTWKSFYCPLVLLFWCGSGQSLTIGMKGRKLYHGPSWNELSSGRSQCGMAHRLARESSHVAGERSARIVGGFPVEAPIPWQASVERKDSRGNWKHICGGSLISEHHILTAAHCIDSHNKFRVTLGKHKLKMTSPYQQSYEIYPSNVVTHRRFGAVAEFANDIAILRIETATGSGAELNEHVHPICLPSQVDWEVDMMEPNHSECIVSGFGTTNGSFPDKLSNHLRAATVSLHSSETCSSLYNRDSYQNLFDGPVEDPFISNNRLRSFGMKRAKGFGSGKHFVNEMLCAGPRSGTSDHCSGDSGGPLACKRNGRYYLVGIVSWGRNCGEEKLPGTYTRVSHYLPWIANEKLLLGP